MGYLRFRRRCSSSPFSFVYTMLAHTQTTHQRHGSSLRSTPCAWSPLLGSSRLQTAPDQHLISRARRFLKYASTSPPRPPRRGVGADEPWRFPWHGLRHVAWPETRAPGTWCTAGPHTAAPNHPACFTSHSPPSINLPSCSLQVRFYAPRVSDSAEYRCAHTSVPAC